jgi:hypothetical protein
MAAPFMFDVYEAVYNFERGKANRAKIHEDF